MSQPGLIPRRRFLSTMGAGLALGLLAACGGQGPTTASTGGASSAGGPSAATTSTAAGSAVTSAAATSASSSAAPSAAAATSAAATSPAAAQAQAPGGAGEEIHFLCRPDIVTAYGAQAAIKAYMDSHSGTKVTLEQPPQGADLLTKVRAAIASNSLVWDGFSVMVAPWDTATWVEAQVIQPLDALLNTSREKDAAALLPGAIPTIAESIKYKGKTYVIPGNVGSIALQWFWEPLKGIGLTKQPATWDETYAAAQQIKAKYPDWTPFAENCTPLCGFLALMYAATPPDQLFTKDGTLNLQAKGAVDALNWMRKLTNEGLMPPTDKGVSDDFNRKKLAMVLSYDVLGEGAQKTYGYDAADTGINIFPQAGVVNSGTPFWMNSSVVFNKAKNPQGMADFFIWWFGPSNGPAQQTLVATAAKPCYTYTYDKYVKGDPKFQWEQVGIDLVAKSAPTAANTYFNIEQTAIGPWEDKFLAKGSNLTAEAALQGAAKDIADKIAAQS